MHIWAYVATPYMGIAYVITLHANYMITQYRDYVGREAWDD